MSEASMNHRADERVAGRHRGQASAEENEVTAPQGRHRRTEEN